MSLLYRAYVFLIEYEISLWGKQNS